MIRIMLILMLAAAASAQLTSIAHAVQQPVVQIPAVQQQPGVQPAPVQQPVTQQPGVQPAPVQQPVAADAAAANDLNSALGGAPATLGSPAVSSNAATPMPMYAFSNSNLNGGGPMAALLNSVTTAAGNSVPMQSGVQSFDKPLSGSAMAQESTAVVQGLIEKFMHKAQLAPGEKTCLQNNMATFAGDVMGTVGDIVTAVKALIAGNGQVAKDSSGGLVSAGLDSAMKITSLVTLSTTVISKCVHGDALVLLQTCAHHLTNVTYLEHRFIVNGVDIAHALADSVVSFEQHNFKRFGEDLGFALRKLLLSAATNATRLPEGVPEEVIIQKTTDGLMKGFFVQGSSVEITDSAHSDIDVVIDLHKCIGGNSEFFKELWMAAWDLIAQISVNPKQHGLGGAPAAAPQAGGQPKWTGELMIAMMQFPLALSNCGVSQEMQSTFMEAIQSLNALKVQFHMPADSNMAGVTDQATEVTNKMAKAVEAWTNWDFEGFGFQLGELLRELVMLAFPQKYSVDASGRLRRFDQVQAMTGARKAGSISSATVIVGGAAMCVLVAFAAVRTRRSLPQFYVEPTPIKDIEDGDVVESVE